MVKDITKRMSIFSLALIAAMATICGVTGMTANKVSADEAYSETWVIKESWTWTKDVTVTINGKVAGDGCASPDAEFESHKDRDYTFGTFSVTGSGAEDARIKLNGQEISIHSSGGNPYFGYPCKLMNMSYDGWVTASGTLTFYSDTSAAEYSELRAWLEQNATEQTADIPAVKKYTVTFKDEYSGTVFGSVEVEANGTLDEATVQEMNEKPDLLGYGVPIDTWKPYYPDTTTPITADTVFEVVFVYGLSFFDGETPIDWFAGEDTEYKIPDGYMNATAFPCMAKANFLGWAKEGGDEVLDLSKETFSPKKIYKLHAVYKAETAKYTVTFKDGEKVLYTLSVESGKAINLSEHTEINESATKTGYTFKGWAARIDGAVIAKNGYLPNITADTTLYAVYEKTSGTDIPSDKPSDNPSDNSSDNPDVPADKPSDSAGDNITLDKSDVKKYVGITLGALGVLLVIAFIVNVFGRRR